MTEPIAADLLPPTCVLRVGITGHRSNRLPADVAPLRAALTEVMQQLAADAQTLLAEGGRGLYRDAAQGPKLRLTGGLAPGADRLAMQTAQTMGWDTQVVLPRPRAAFLAEQRSACSTREEDSDAEFAGLVDAATAMLTLDGDGEGHRRNAHELAARVIVEQSDVLIAVWDGQPAAGMGGTGHLVREALAQNVAVILISPDGDQPIAYLLPQGTDCTRADFLAWLRSMLLLDVSACNAPASASVTSNADSSAQQRWQRTLRETLRASTFPPLYQCMMGLAGKRWPRWRLSYANSVENWAENWQHYENTLSAQASPEGNYATLRQRFHFFDHLAELYGRQYRASYLLIYLLAFLATSFGLAGVFTDIVTKAWLVSIELLLIITMAVVAWRGVKNDWQERWLDYRAIAEQLRHARLGMWTGQSLEPAKTASCEAPTAAWTGWYLRACQRELPMPTAEVTADYCKQAIASIDEYEIRYQATFNQNTAHVQEHLHELFEHAEIVLLAILMGVALLFLLMVASNSLQWLDVPTGFKYAMKHTMSVCGIIIPALGAVMLGIKAQADFQAYADRARETATELESVSASINLGATQHPYRFEDVCDVVDATIAAMASDIHAWRSVYRRKTLNVAA